jgi:hypothetical protein
MPHKNAHRAVTPASQQTLPHLNEEQQNELFNVQKRKAELELQALEEETQARCSLPCGLGVAPTVQMVLG